MKKCLYLLLAALLALSLAACTQRGTQERDKPDSSYSEADEAPAPPTPADTETPDAPLPLPADLAFATLELVPLQIREAGWVVAPRSVDLYSDRYNLPAEVTATPTEYPEELVHDGMAGPIPDTTVEVIRNPVSGRSFSITTTYHLDDLLDLSAQTGDRVFLSIAGYPWVVNYNHILRWVSEEEILYTFGYFPSLLYNTKNRLYHTLSWPPGEPTLEPGEAHSVTEARIVSPTWVDPDSGSYVVQIITFDLEDGERDWSSGYQQIHYCNYLTGQTLPLFDSPYVPAGAGFPEYATISFSLAGDGYLRFVLDNRFDQLRLGEEVAYLVCTADLSTGAVTQDLVLHRPLTRQGTLGTYEVWSAVVADEPQVLVYDWREETVLLQIKGDFHHIELDRYLGVLSDDTLHLLDLSQGVDWQLHIPDLYDAWPQLYPDSFEHGVTPGFATDDVYWTVDYRAMLDQAS